MKTVLFISHMLIMLMVSWFQEEHGSYHAQHGTSPVPQAVQNVCTLHPPQRRGEFCSAVTNRRVIRFAGTVCPWCGFPATGFKPPREWVHLLSPEKELACTGPTSGWKVGRQWCRQPCTFRYATESHSDPCANFQLEGLGGCGKVWWQAAAKACIPQAADGTSARNGASPWCTCASMCGCGEFRHIWNGVCPPSQPSRGPVMPVYWHIVAVRTPGR